MKAFTKRVVLVSRELRRERTRLLREMALLVCNEQTPTSYEDEDRGEAAQALVELSRIQGVRCLGHTRFTLHGSPVGMKIHPQ